MTTPALRAQDLTKIYTRGTETVRAVDGVSLEIAAGEFAAIVGPSGSGKTSLVNILGCLDNPTSGSLTVDGVEIVSARGRLSERELTRHRRARFGYVFQGFYLIPSLTVLENVTLPFAFYRKPGVATDVRPLLASLGLEHRLGHYPHQLSGGEMQRVAIARALVNRPAILLADEPTGSLDTARGEEIGALLKSLNRRDGLTLLLVTHNPALAALADRVITLRDGRVA